MKAEILYKAGEMYLGKNSTIDFKYVIKVLEPREKLTVNINVLEYFKKSEKGNYVLTVKWQGERNSKDKDIKFNSAYSIHYPFGSNNVL